MLQKLRHFSVREVFVFTPVRRPRYRHGTVNVFALREGGRDILFRGGLLYCLNFP